MQKILTLAVAMIVRVSDAAPVSQANLGAYPTNEHFVGKTVAPLLITARDREFATVLRRSAKNRANYAGHYNLTMVGCGTSCLMVAALDAKSGHVTWLPVTLCCWAPDIAEPVEFRLNSSLIILRGKQDEAGPDGPHYWRLSRQHFLPVK